MTRLIALALLLAPLPAFAHSGEVHLQGFVVGLLHPVSGLDHILAMLAVGLWAGLLGGRAAWLLPAGFLGGMAAGGAFGIAGIGLPMVEAGILASVIVLGALVAASARVRLAIAVPLVAVFGLLHGHAHGAELAAGIGAAGYAFGFLAATATLHAIGVLGALTASDGTSRNVVRAAGGAMVALLLVARLG